MTSSISDAADLRAALAEAARAQGFVATGVCAADAAPAASARLRAWLADGCHGDMLWMETTAGRRQSPRALWPDVRSVVMLGFPYTPPVDPLRHAGHPDIGVISVYALGADYHDLVKRRLKAVAGWLAARTGAQLKVFVDTAPVMEKALAEAAGIGWQGRHSNIVSREHGNWLFLGAIYTEAEIAPDAPHRDLCGSCDRCVAACPTGAIKPGRRVDARECISYLTIEHSGPIPERFRGDIGNRIYGCDDCLAACPWNRFAHATSEFAIRAELEAPRLADLLALDDAAFRAVFAGSPVKRIGRDRLVRNAAIAAGNSGDPGLVSALAPLVSDDSPVVAEAARWALAQLRRRAAA